MSSAVEICNLALSHLGSSGIDALDERSEAAAACTTFYAICRDMVLRDAPWPFATKMQALALVEEDPNTEWGFSYRYPSDCLDFRRIQSGKRNDDRQSRVPYKFGSDNAGQLVFTDMENAVAEYGARITDSQRFPLDFVLALSRLIAFHISPRVVGQDPFKLGPLSLQVYQSMIVQAKANAFNEQQEEELPESEFIRTRDS